MIENKAEIKLFQQFAKKYIAMKQIDWKINEELISSNRCVELVINDLGRPLVYLVNEARLNGQLIGDTPQERYQDYITRYIDTGKSAKRLGELFPILVSDLQNDIKQYSNEIKNIMKLYEQDQIELQRDGVISRIEPIKSVRIEGDLHGGQGVAIVELTDKQRFVYKPKSIANEIFVNGVLEFAERNSTKVLENYKLKALDKDCYGWMEYVSHSDLKSKNDAFQYYQRLGQLTAIAYILGLSDLHFENLVSQSDFPVLIDKEVIFSESLLTPQLLNNAQVRVNERIVNSVTGTGLLPIKNENKNFGGDTSAFMGGTFTTKQRVLENAGRDDLHFVRKVVRTKNTDHLPSYDNIPILPSDYLQSIKLGFQNVYFSIFDNKQSFIEWAELPSKAIKSRVLIRNTMEYGTLLQAAQSPTFSSKRAALFNKLRTYPALESETVIDSEIAQLDMLSVPFFYQRCDSNNVYDIFNQVVYSTGQSLFTNFKKVINKMSLYDCAEQLTMIDFSITSMEKLRYDGTKFNRYDNSKHVVNDESRLDTAKAALLKIIIDNAVVGDDNTVNWMNLTVGELDEFEFQVSDNSLYNGVAGFALPLLQAYQESHSVKLKKLLEQVVCTLKNDTQESDYSLFNGRLGQLLIIQNIEKVLNCNQSEKEPIKRCLQDTVHSTRILYDDVIAGYAGQIIAIYKNVDDLSDYMDELNGLGNILLKNGIIKGDTEYWQARDGSTLVNPSFAHGNSGILSALLIMYKLTAELKYFNAFLCGWNFEKQFKTDLGWKDLRKSDKRESPYWCHGAAGILEARLIWVQIDDEMHCLNAEQRLNVEDECWLATRNLLNIGLQLENFSLCHGVMGSLVALNDFARYVDNEKIKSIVKHHMNVVCEFGLEKGWICGLGTHYFSYGLFTGISGILLGIDTISSDTESILSLKL
ncbi:type 2 lantipeptide synthetase LanM [Periweissella cryptocerci]|uniref:Type 2 lantipeptide synthetase LanM n=1 Tax=Periweissella cryptocerci TaxID=2506420 RepID=A0A4P6YUC9_9LACO|nr:type 2 lanthipeptide synthetase LanM family protein [Periweissella cryptocerci]QBO36287.1 type 2 lantipeptide synthetase LanM [Periweissella cryptocerci]